ncbi:phage tail tape measure protein [Clostridium sp. UBA5988]|uniref:phage tail tape measure protein n=1 Tax=Clostridium sp. UBA5988 TaxID=1946369 RepID=UPI003216FF2A
MAANSSTVIARIGLDDRGFQDGVAKIQRGLKLVQSEFAVASSKLGDFGKSTEGLKLKSDTLNKQIEIQKDKVSALNKSYQESVEKKGADTKATENLKIKLNYAVAELNKMENELKSTTKELKEKSSAWYKLSESMDKAGEKMKAVGDKMSSAGKKLTTAVTLPLVGIGTAATKMAMDAEESENLFEVAMGTMAGDARKWSEETSKALSLNAFNVRKNVATYNSMLTSMGLASEESLKMSEGLTQLSYDMASFYNLKPEEAFEKLKSGISGEAEPLKALGILVNDNTIKTYAYSNGIAKQGEQLTEAQKVQARYGAILDATKNAQGDLARTMDSPTNKIRAMKEQAQQIGIQFGQILIPILEKLIAVIKPLMDKFQGLSKEQQEQIVKIGLIVAAVGPIILIIGKVVTIIGTLFSIVSTVSGAIAAAGGVSAAFGAVLGALTGPVAIVIAVITGLIAVGVLLYKNWDAIKEFMVKMWEQVKVSTSNAVLALKTVISSTFNAIGSCQ